MSAAAQHRMTAEEFARYAATQSAPCELINGEVRHLAPAGSGHGYRTNDLGYFITHHVRSAKLGYVFTAETGFRLDDGSGRHTVRAPDVSFVARHRLENPDDPGFLRIAPDLAVETISPSDRAADVAEKVSWWLSHGVRLVWVLDPQNQTITAYHPDGSARVLQRHDTLDGGDVLPGFSLALAELFA